MDKIIIEGGRRLSGSTAAASGSAAAVAALPAKQCAAGDSVCEKAAALLAAEQKPAVPELVCKVGGRTGGGAVVELAAEKPLMRVGASKPTVLPTALTSLLPSLPSLAVHFLRNGADRPPLAVVRACSLGCPLPLCWSRTTALFVPACNALR